MLNSAQNGKILINRSRSSEYIEVQNEQLIFQINKTKGDIPQGAGFEKFRKKFEEYNWSIDAILSEKKSSKLSRSISAQHSDVRGVINRLCDILKQNNPSLKIHNKNTSKQPFIFLIDEINRGDMSKIFGELFFSIDPGYRGEDGKIPTQYQNLVNEEDDPFYKGFYIPKNVYIIGTMNDIDRSVESMDFAMRRRFQFIEVTAESRAEGMGLIKKDAEGNITKTEAYERMTKLNNCISRKVENDGIGLSSAYHIGGSYFLKEEVDESGKTVNKPIETLEEFTNLWEYRLKGLLREYLRGYDDADSKIERLKKAFNDTSVKTQKTDSTQQHEGAESAENSNEENA